MTTKQIIIDGIVHQSINLTQYRDYVIRCGANPSLNYHLNGVLDVVERMDGAFVKDAYIFNSEMGAFVRSLTEASFHFGAAMGAVEFPSANSSLNKEKK